MASLGADTFTQQQIRESANKALRSADNTVSKKIKEELAGVGGKVDDVVDNVQKSIHSKQLVNRKSSLSIKWKNLDDKNIIWNNPDNNILSTSKSFANEIGNSLYDVILADGYYVKFDLNDGRILLGNVDGSYYAFAILNDVELGSFKSSILSVNNETFNVKLTEFLSKKTEKLKVLSGVVSKPVTIAGQTLTLNKNKVNTILGRYKPDIAQIFNELGSFKNVGLGETKGGINLLNKPDHYYNPTNWWNAYNKPWLDKAITRGDDIYLATIPEKSEDIVKEGKLLGAYAEELNYLVIKNYKPKNITEKQWKNIKNWINKK